MSINTSGNNVTADESMKALLETTIAKVNELTSYCTNLRKIIEVLDKNKDKLIYKVDKLKIELTELNQYGRRESIEISNIPESIHQNALEDHVIKILNSIHVKLTHYDIVAVHRIGKRSSKPRNVIIRFLNRKSAFLSLKNRRMLKNGEYKGCYISENLCPYNRKLFNRLYKLKKTGHIHHVWTYNGSVYMCIEENGDTKHVQHSSDIDYYLYEDDYTFSSEHGSIIGENTGQVNNVIGVNNVTSGSNITVVTSN